MKQTVLVMVLCLMFQQGMAKLQPLSEGMANMRYSIASCVLSATEEFHREDLVTVALTTLDYKNYTNSAVVTDQLLLRTLHQQIKWTLLVTKSNNPEKRSKFFKKSDEYIIQIRDRDEFDVILTALMRKSSWNPYGRFIIFTTTVFPNPATIVQYIFQKFWKQRVLNAVIMLPQMKDSPVLDVYSWFPFQNGNCGDQFSVAQIVNSCHTGRMANTGVLFPEKIPLDMNGCIVRVRAIVWPPYIIPPVDFNDTQSDNVNFTKGIEILLLNTVAQVANFTVQYSVSKVNQDWGILLLDGTGTGLMGALLRGEADIGIGALAPFDQRHYYFDASISYIRESVTWCIPHAKPMPRWKCLLGIFQPGTLITITLTYIILTLCVWLVSRNDPEESTSYKSTQSCFQNLLSILLGITVNTLPKIVKTRFLIFLWIVVSLNLNSVFTSSLIRELTQPSFEKSNNSIENLIYEGYTIGLVSPTQRFLSNSRKLKYIKSHSIVSCFDVIKCLDRAAYKRDFAVGLPRMYMQYASNKYITAKGQHLLHWMKEDIASYPVEMIMTKGFPLLARINALIFRIREAGLISKWQEDFLEKINRTLVLQQVEDDDNILTLTHLEGAFIFLCLGLVIAAAVFVVELFMCRREKYYKI